MGVSLSWLAVRGMAPEAVRQALGLAATGRPAEEGRVPVAAAALPDGWYLLVARGRDAALASDGSTRRVSAGGEAVAVSVEEHVMYAAAAHWRDGEQAWSVRHQGEEDPDHLEMHGAPPEDLEERVAEAKEARAEDDEVDFVFSVPLDLARELPGYSHEDFAPEGAAFEELEEPAPVPAPGAGQRPWWRFWA